jgi:hypothetical protein
VTPSFALETQPPADHPGLGQGERGEHPHHVELDQLGEMSLEHPDQEPRQDGEGHHAVGEHEPVAPVSELRRHKPVPGQDGGEPGEVLVGGVRGQHQDSRCEGLQHEEQESPAEDRFPDLGQHGSRLGDLLGDPDVEEVAQ